jgi:hypothetical protein
MGGAIGTVYVNTPMFAGPGYRVFHESQAEEREIVSVLLEEAMAQAASREHAVAAWIHGEMEDESLIGIIRAITDGNDCMRHVIPELRHDFTGPALVCAKIGCVVETPEHADRLLASNAWCCFTTLPRLITVPADRAIDTLMRMDFDSALVEHRGVDLDLCRDHDVVTVRAVDGCADKVAESLIDRWDPKPRRGVSWVIDADALPDRKPDARHQV